MKSYQLLIIAILLAVASCGTFKNNTKFW